MAAKTVGMILREQMTEEERVEYELWLVAVKREETMLSFREWFEDRTYRAAKFMLNPHHPDTPDDYAGVKKLIKSGSLWALSNAQGVVVFTENKHIGFVGRVLEFGVESIYRVTTRV